VLATVSAFGVVSESDLHDSRAEIATSRSEQVPRISTDSAIASH
jgi:hypothetical protein